MAVLAKIIPGDLRPGCHYSGDNQLARFATEDGLFYYSGIMKRAIRQQTKRIGHSPFSQG